MVHRLPPGILSCRCGRCLQDPSSIVDNAISHSQTWRFHCLSCFNIHTTELSYQLLATLSQAPFHWSTLEPPAPQPKLVPQPDRTIQGSVIGYRAWRIVNWQLYGTGVNRAWIPGINEATCDAGQYDGSSYFGYSNPNRHPAPAIGCHCGITALARFTRSDTHWTGADVFGVIEAWGEEEQVPRIGDVLDAVGVLTTDIIAGIYGLPPNVVRVDQGYDPSHEDESGGFILHHNGFRARYGKVVLLAIEDDWPVAKTAAVRALAREHGADVCKREHLEDAAKEHGQLVDDELLRWAGEGESSNMASYFSGSYTVTINQAAQSFNLATHAMQTLGYSSNQARAAFGLPALSPSPKPVKPKRNKHLRRRNNDTADE